MFHPFFSSRRKPFALLLFAGLLTLLLASGQRAARADIDYYRLFKSVHYRQTSDAQPTTPLNYSGAVDILTHTPADFITGLVLILSPLGGVNVTPTSGYGQYYSTQAELDTYFPNNSLYFYSISGGLLGNQFGTLTTPSSSLFAPEIPYFNGNTYSRLQGMNAAAPFQFTFPGYTRAPGINSSPLFFSIYRVSDGRFMYGIGAANTLTSVTIPASTLEPGVAYTAFLDYSSRIATTNAGFNRAISEVAFDSGVDLAFTTAAVPTIPAITGFSPASVAAGGPDFTLTVHGTNFVPASVVQWNLQNLPTTFVSSTELSVGVPAAFIANPGAAAINVVNPPGDLAHTSNTAYFAITQPNPANITSQTTVTRSGFRYVRATGHYVQTVTVRNASLSAYSGPLHLVLDSLSANAALFNRIGLTTYYLPLNSPYVSNALASVGNGDSVFNSGESVTFTLEFANPTNAAITYTPRVLAGSGTP